MKINIASVLCQRCKHMIDTGISFPSMGGKDKPIRYCTAPVPAVAMVLVGNEKGLPIHLVTTIRSGCDCFIEK